MSVRGRTILLSRWCLPGPGLLALLILTGCGEETATGVGDDLFPIEPRTVEISLPWSEFGQDLRVFGGFGRVSDLPRPILAGEYQGVLTARTLSRFTRYPRFVEVRDTTDDVVRSDSSFAFLGGRLIARVDTTGEEQFVDLEARRPPAGWDPTSVTWTAAVDTVGERVPWEEPGAGPAPRAGQGSWDPTEEGDSVVIELDSATVHALGDTAALAGGIRLDATTPDSWVDLRGLTLEVDVVPSMRPDTVVSFRASSRSVAFIYDPPPEAATDEIRIGGAPAWRSTIRVTLPEVLDGPPEFCAQVGCPFELDASRLSAATLDLTTRPAPLGFQPRDSARVDARPVLAPDHLPKAPLGSSFVVPSGVAVGPGAFGESAGAVVGVPITTFIRDLVRGETQTGDDAPDVLAFLSVSEPLDLSLASFVAPGEPGEPVLRLVLTTSDTVQIR